MIKFTTIFIISLFTYGCVTAPYVNKNPSRNDPSKSTPLKDMGDSHRRGRYKEFHEGLIEALGNQLKYYHNYNRY